MNLGLADNVTLVFGAARGIGAAIAKAFADEGSNVVVIDRDPSVHELARSVPRSFALVADVTDYTAVRHVSQQVNHRFGRCDHVVFAVGVGSGKFGFPFWKLEPHDWERVLKINLIGAVNVAHAFAPAMAAAAQLRQRHRSGQEPDRRLVAVDALSFFRRRSDRLAD